MKKHKFVILSIGARSGGAIVLENLARCLDKLGMDSKVLYPASCRGSDEREGIYIWEFIKFLFKRILPQMLTKNKEFPIRGCRIKFTPFVSSDTIVIYPDITYGNPLRAKKVVRWFLYHNRFPNDKYAYGENDLFIAYRPVFNDYDLNPTCRTLHTPYFDLDVYKQTNYAERSGKCYIIRKGEKRKDLPKEFDGPIIDDLPEEEKVRVFNQCEWCICYDTQTAYSRIAALCGCISVVVPELNKTREDYCTSTDCSLGVAYGFSDEEISYAIQIRNQVYDYYRETNDRSLEEVKKFVAVCEEYFKDR